jgi:adhesin/invasin
MFRGREWLNNTLVLMLHRGKDHELKSMAGIHICQRPSPHASSRKRQSIHVWPQLRLLPPLLLAIAMLVVLLWVVPTNAAGITVWKEVSAGTVEAGEPFTYTIHVSNTTGNKIAMRVTDVIPSGLNVINAGGGTVSDGEIEWSLTVNHGASIEAVFSVYGTTAGEVTNDTYQASSMPNYGTGPGVTTDIEPGDPGSIIVDADPNPTTVGASAQLVITTTDAYGNLVADGTALSIEFDAGTVDGNPAGTTINATTSNGVVLKTLDAGTVATTCHITVTAGSVQQTEQVVFAAGPADSLVVTTHPDSIAVGGVEYSTITATVADAYDNPVIQTPVTVTTSLGELNEDGSTAVVETDSSGQAVVTLAGTVAGTAQVQIETNSLPQAEVSVYLAPGPPTHLSMEADPTAVTANGTSTSTITLSILDEYNNRVDTPVTATLTTNMGTFSEGGAVYSTTTSNGYVTALLTAGTHAGLATIAGSAVGLNTSTSVDFVPGPADHVWMDIVPQAIPADGTSTTSITATVGDFYGNPISTPISVTLSASGGTLIPDSVGTAENGVMVRQLRSTTLLGSVSVTATAVGLTSPATSTVDFVVGNPYSAQIALSAAQPITAGHPVSMTVTVHDSVGHPVPSAPITISIWLGDITPTASGSTDASGQLQRTLLSTQAGNDIIGILSANGPLQVAGGSVQYVPDIPARAELSASPTSIFADGTTTSIITAIIRDQYGNVVAGTTPTFTTTMGTLSGSTASNAAGIVTRTLQSNTNLGTAVVSIPALVCAPNANVAFTSGPPAVVTLDANPTSLFVYNLGSAYKPDETTIVLTVADEVGHPIVGSTLAVTSTFGTVIGSGATDGVGVLTRTLRSTVSGQPQVFVAGIQATGDTITFQPGPLHHVSVTPGSSFAFPVDVTAGIPFTFTAAAQDAYNNSLSGYSFAWTVSTLGGYGSISAGGAFEGSTAGLVHVRATTGDKTGVSYADVGPGSGTSASIVANPLTLPANGAGSSTLAFYVKDAYGNAVSYGQAITVTSSIGIVEGNSLTDASGVAYRTIRSFEAGQAVIQATNLLTTSGNNVITFTPGSPVAASVVADPSVLPANGTDQSTLRITLRDTYGNPVGSGYRPTVATSLGTIAAAPPAGGTTDAQGTVTRTLTAPTVEGLAIFTVSYLGAPLSVTGDRVEFIIGPMAKLIPSPAGPTFVESGQSLPFSAQAYDTDDAPLPSGRVTYGWNLIFTGLGRGDIDAYPKFGPQTVFTATTAGTGVQLIPWADEDATDLYLETPIDITVIPGPPVSGAIAITPSVVIANGISPITFTLSSLFDDYGNQADGSVITVTLHSLPAERIGSQTVSAGEAEIVLNAPTQAGTYTFDVTNARGNAELEGDDTATFVPGSPCSAQVLSLTPAEIVANGTSTSTIVMQISDAHGNAVVAGHTPVISSSIGSILPGFTPTDAAGVLTCTLQADLTVGPVSLMMNGSPASGSQPALIAGPPAVSYIDVSTTTLTVGGDTTQVVIHVLDAWDHPVADGLVITPTLSPYPTAPGDWGSLSGICVTSEGIVEQELRSGTSAGTVMLATDGISTTGDMFVDYIPDTASMARVEAAPNPLLVGETTVVTLTLTDSYGNATTPITVTITSSHGLMDGTEGPITRTSAADTGLITTALSSTVAGTHTLTVKRLDGVALGIDEASDEIMFLPDEPIMVALQPAGPITISAGAVVTITASSQDQHGNAVDPWTPVDYTWWQASAAGQPGRGSLTGIDVNGRSVRFGAILAGANRLWATGGITVSNALTVNVLPAAPAAAAADVAPGIVPADGASTFVVTLTNVVDAQGNTVQDGTPLTVTVASDPAVSKTGAVNNGTLTMTLSSSTDAGNYVIVAHGPGGTLSLSGNKAISFTPGEPTRAAISANPTSIAADGASTSNLVITIRDANSNLVADGTPITVTTTLGTISGSGTTLNGSVNRTLRAPLTLGTAEFSVESAAGPLFTTGDTVDFVPGAATKAQVTAAPAQVPADGVSTSYLTIMLRDAQGFAVHGDGAAQLSVMQGSIVPTTTTASNGIITATFHADTSVGMADLTVAYEGAILQLEGDTLELIAGPAVSATLTALPTSLPVGSQDGANLTVRLYDAWNRPIADGTPVTVTTSLGSIESQEQGSVGGTVTRELLPGPTMGTATFMVQTPNGQLTPTGDTVQITAGTLDHIIISPSGPMQATACTTTTFSARGEDMYGNATGTGIFNWVLYAAPDSENQLSNTGVFTATEIGEVGIQAFQGFKYSSIVNVTVAPGTPTTATVTASPTSISVGDGASILTITAQDACGNLVADGTQLSVTTNLGTVTGSSTTVNGTLTRTLRAANYYGTSTIFVNGWQAAGDRVSIISGGVSQASMTASPASLPADGISISILRLTLRDAAGMPVTDGTTPDVSASLGTISGSTGTMGGVLTRTLHAPLTPGVAYIYANGIQASGSVEFVVGEPVLAEITADPPYLPADGASAVTLMITVQDAHGHALEVDTPLTVTTSLGAIGGVAPTVDGVTTRVLTASAESGVARITVSGLTATGDAAIHFVGDWLQNGDFEAGMEDWSGGGVLEGAAVGPIYTATVVSHDIVDGVTVLPRSGGSMMRLGATTDDNTAHALSQAWLRQPVQVPQTGLTQITFWYRLLSYDVSVGAADYGYPLWDPFQTALDEQTVLQDGYPWTYAWQTWYVGPPSPSSPKDMGWKQGVLDLTPYAGTIIAVDFRLPNWQAAVDNTWVFIDDVVMVNQQPKDDHTTFLPIVLTAP